MVVADPALLLGAEQLPLPREGNIRLVLQLTSKHEPVSAERITGVHFAEAGVVLRVSSGLPFVHRLAEQLVPHHF